MWVIGEDGSYEDIRDPVTLRRTANPYNTLEEIYTKYNPEKAAEFRDMANQWEAKRDRWHRRDARKNKAREERWERERLARIEWKRKEEAGIKPTEEELEDAVSLKELVKLVGRGKALEVQQGLINILRG